MKVSSHCSFWGQRERHVPCLGTTHPCLPRTPLQPRAVVLQTYAHSASAAVSPRSRALGAVGRAEARTGQAAEPQCLLPQPMAAPEPARAGRGSSAPRHAPSRHACRPRWLIPALWQAGCLAPCCRQQDPQGHPCCLMATWAPRAFVSWTWPLPSEHRHAQVRQDGHKAAPCQGHQSPLPRSRASAHSHQPHPKALSQPEPQTPTSPSPPQPARSEGPFSAHDAVGQRGAINTPWDTRPCGEPAGPEHPFWSLNPNRDLVLPCGEMELLAIRSCLQPVTL